METKRWIMTDVWLISRDASETTWLNVVQTKLWGLITLHVSHWEVEFILVFQVPCSDTSSSYNLDLWPVNTLFTMSLPCSGSYTGHHLRFYQFIRPMEAHCIVQGLRSSLSAFGVRMGEDEMKRLWGHGYESFSPEEFLGSTIVPILVLL